MGGHYTLNKQSFHKFMVFKTLQKHTRRCAAGCVRSGVLCVFVQQCTRSEYEA